MEFCNSIHRLNLISSKSQFILLIYSEYSTKLLELQEAAKAAKKGKWALEEGSAQQHVRLKASITFRQL